MSRKLLSLSLTASLLAGTAMAEVPRVAADIAPVHSLVARVMEGVGTPDLIVSAGASPHEYVLRPSQAAALQDADIVFWTSANLTPWLDGALETLAADASVTELLGVQGTIELPFREGALFDAHAHEETAEEHDDHGEHDDHADHAEEDHMDEGHADEGHDHGATDPHAWLSPDNAATWLNAIAASLSAADPDNAGAYFANAAAGRAELAALSKEIAQILDPVRDRNFIVFHDAYQYFEGAFDFPSSGAISISDAADPSPARIAEIQGRVAEQNVTCVLSEPQFNAKLVTTVMDGSAARTAVLDPLGSDLAPGPQLYPQLIRNLATTLADCL
ncbi:zinc ABC transporter substrate-binding protein [Yoonia sp.]|uniref:zinc ABC transporter substrate-binding protein n=1 Tax=Yoonia sp. TaxID=2212373 RepID=UPI003F6D8EA6